MTPPLHILDPSLAFRPEKDTGDFRNYSADNILHDRVKDTYLRMHTNQNVDFVKAKITEWTKFDHAEMTMMEALDTLSTIVDESDPDVDIPNDVHAFQTAERIRQVYPDLDWLQLVGLIHDIGKLMICYGESQWAVVGDTFPVGCQFSDEIVFGRESFKANEDNSHSVYSTKLGMYKEHCGLNNLLMSWSHDEYLYRVLKNHASCTLPEVGLYIIRFHSFYPYHTSGEYGIFKDSYDMDNLKWINKFNEFDLYSKSDELPISSSLRGYYQGLVDKYIPGVIKW